MSTSHFFEILAQCSLQRRLGFGQPRLALGLPVSSASSRSIRHSSLFPTPLSSARSKERQEAKSQPNRLGRLFHPHHCRCWTFISHVIQDQSAQAMVGRSSLGAINRLLRFPRAFRLGRSSFFARTGHAYAFNHPALALCYPYGQLLHFSHCFQLVVLLRTSSRCLVLTSSLYRSLCSSKPSCFRLQVKLVFTSFQIPSPSLWAPSARASSCEARASSGGST